MNVKIAICVLLAILGLYGLTVIWHPPVSVSLQTVQSPQPQEMIAPAIVDSLNDITRIPTLQGGLIEKMHVMVGQQVKKGQPLFSLERTLAQRSVNINQWSVQQAENDILTHARILKHAQVQLKRLQSLDARAVSRNDVREKKHEIKLALMQLKQLQQHKKIALANLKNAQLSLSQFTTVAPTDGVVLQINAHVNEYVGGANQIIYLGDANKMIVRVSIDERDIKYFDPNAPAYITTNDNQPLNIPLTFIQLDRFVITQERLNARVQEALYSVDRVAYPNLIAGQQLDAHLLMKAVS